VPDAGSPDPGGRVYRTGDLGRYLPTGDVEFAGRTDFQVKIRGFRIEPGEIEAVLTRHPAIRECIVIARDGAGGEKRLVAYLIPHEQVGGGALRDLRAWLKDRLPEAMIPAAFVNLERLPLNPNGKVDRRALPEPGQDALAEAGAFVAPTNETERTIAAVLQDVLGQDRIGIHDNFFELGGNSLLLVRAHARLRESIGGDLQVVDLFSHPTVAMLAVYLGRGAAAPSAARQSDARMDKVEAGQSRLQKLRQRRQQG
jgi:aryl carrier-like protein